MEEKKTLFKRVKENKWEILAGVGFTTSAVLGIMYGNELMKNKQFDNTADLVKRVVGGPLIERLIKNEELKLSRTTNKIDNILSKEMTIEMTKSTEKLLEDLNYRKQNIIETIADFVSVRDALK